MQKGPGEDEGIRKHYLDSMESGDWGRELKKMGRAARKTCNFLPLATRQMELQADPAHKDTQHVLENDSKTWQVSTWLLP